MHEERKHLEPRELSAPRPPLRKPPPALYSVSVMTFVPTVPRARGAGRFPSRLPRASAWERGRASGPGRRLLLTPSMPRPEVTASRKPLSPGLQGGGEAGEGPPPSVGLPQLPLAGPSAGPQDKPAPLSPGPLSTGPALRPPGALGSSCFRTHERCRPGGQAAREGPNQQARGPSTFRSWKSHPGKSRTPGAGAGGGSLWRPVLLNINVIWNNMPRRKGHWASRTAGVGPALPSLSTSG